MQQVVESFYNWYREQIRHPKYRWLIILGTLAYLFSPIDILPDLIPVIGWLDDGILLTLLTTELSRLILDYRKNRQAPGAPTSDNLITVDSAPVEASSEVK